MTTRRVFWKLFEIHTLFKDHLNIKTGYTALNFKKMGASSFRINLFS